MGVLKAAERLRDAVGSLELGVPFVYDPLAYAWEPHARYAERFGARAPRRALLVGMNPGPNGMGQTGVPFGDVVMVRDWMGIEGRVTQPPRLHPKRPVTGFATKRREPSGSRLYGWAQARYGTAERFFADFYVANYCPLLFYDAAGKNLTPPDLKKGDTEDLYVACDEHLAAVARALRPAWILGVGAFAEGRIREVADAHRLDAQVGSILHPSPANPAANRGWAQQAEAKMIKLGVLDAPTPGLTDAKPAKKSTKGAKAPKRAAKGQGRTRAG
jgi:single-strand selective monofunctional uracil DNA glycosylase